MSKRLVIVVLALVASACATGGTDEPRRGGAEESLEAARTAQAWLARDSNSAILLRWNEDASNQLSGVLQMAHLADHEVSGETWPVEGLLGGTGLTITVDGLFGTVTRLTGDVDGDRLTIFWPSESGSLQPVQFSRSTVAQYNDAVAELQGTGAEQRAWAQEAEAGSKALADADQKLATAANALNRAIGGYAANVGWAQSAVDDVARALDDVRSAISDLEDAVANDPDYAPTELAWVESELQYLSFEVEYARGSNGVGGIESAVSELNRAVADVENAIDALRSAEALYLNSEFAPYDTATESVLIDRAESIIGGDGPQMVIDLLDEIDNAFAEGEALLAHARSLVD